MGGVVGSGREGRYARERTMNPTGVHLTPGTYLLELSTARRTTPDAVRRGLEAAGFDSVVADELGTVNVPPVVGAAMMGPSAAASIHPLAATGPSLAARSATSSTPKLADMAKAILAAPPIDANSPSRGGLLKASSLAATARTTDATPKLADTAKAIMQKAAEDKLAKLHPRGLGGGGGGVAASQGGGGDGGGGDGGGSTDGGGEPAPNFVPDPNDPSYATDTTSGNEYYLDDQGTMWQVDQGSNQLVPIDQNTLKPVAGQRQPAPPKGIPVGTTAGTISAADDIAKPLGEDPAFMISISGALLRPPSEEDIYRFVANTPMSMTLKPGDDISWAARRVTIDPYADVMLSTRAFPLLHGITYDMLVLGRDRNARSRGDIWTLAEAMGFDMNAISLLRRDIRLPGRPNASYSRWLLVGTWKGPDTITTAEEPLIFEQVEPGSDP
jgi:hypothetical protein